MYPVTSTYKTKIKELERVFQARIQIQHSQGVLNLTDKDIALGSLIFNEASQAGEDFTIGGVVASDLTVNIVNKPEYANLQFVGATLTASIGLQLAEDKWELQEVEPDTWEEVQVSEEAWEWVPLGVFHIDEVGKTRNVIRIKAIDAMINLDMPYSLSKLVYPATLLQIFTNICNVCDIQQGSYTFPNSEHVVKDRPDVDSTFRDILAYVAELSGTFARTTRTGALELVWYEESGLTLTGANRFDFVPRDDRVQITGITATVDGVTYIAGGGVETDIYTESGEDFATGTLDGVVAGEEGLGLGLAMGKALSFDGVDDSVRVANDTSLQFGTGSFTLEAKIKLNAFGEKEPAIISKRQATETGAPQFKLQVTTKGELGFATYYNDTSSIRSSSGDIETGRIYHVAAVRNSNGVHQLFIDGAKVAEETLTVRNITNQQPLWIGDDNRDNYSTPYGGHMFKGIIDDVRIWNVARTQQQIQDNMNKELTGNETGLVSYWKFNEGEGTTAYDSAGSNHGTIYGATWVDGIVGSYLEQGSRTSLPLDLSSLGETPDLRAAWQATKPTGTDVTIETAVKGETWHEGKTVGTTTTNVTVQTPILKFDGVDDYIEIPDNSSLRDFTTFKISADVMPLAVDSSWKMIYNKYRDGATTNGMYLGIGNDNKFRARAYTNTGNLSLISSLTPQVDTWYHVELIYDGSTLTLKVNDNVEDSGSLTGTACPNQAVVRIGNRNDATTEPWDGYIRKVELEKNGSLVSSWNLDEGSGSTANDSEGSNDGTITGAKWREAEYLAGHRGYSAVYPENTMIALQRAVEEGCNAIEFDVRQTSDSEMVLMHDATVDRTTDGTGNVHDLTLAQIQELDAGSWKSSEFAGETVPTLEEILDEFKDVTDEFTGEKIILLIELKENVAYSDMPTDCANMIVSKNMIDQCIVMSFDWDYLDEVKTVNSNIKTALLGSGDTSSAITKATTDGHNVIAWNYSYLSSGIVSTIHGEGLEAAAWAVNSENDIETVFGYGVDSVIGDYADRLVELGVYFVEEEQEVLAYALPYYPVERLDNLVLYDDEVEIPAINYSRSDVNDPRKIVFEEGQEPQGEITADFTGVDNPSETAEVQTLYLGGATGGTYDLGISGNMATLAYNDDAATIQAALEAIFGTDRVTVAADTDFTITFDTIIRSSSLTADFTSLTGATDPALTLNTAYDAGDWEEQTKEKTITNLPDNFTNKYLWVKQVLATEDSAITPVLESLKLYSVTEGGADYLVDLSNNPLLQDNYETALGTIYGAVKGVSFYPFTSQWQGDPAVQAGDIITQVDRDGKPYKTLVTHSTYKYRGASTLQGKGLPVKAKGYKGSTNRKFAEIIRKIDEVVGDKLTTLEQAQLHATEMIANMLGGHAIFTDEAIYIADSEDLDEAVKVWKWGIGGFGYSSTGKDGPYTTAITADGTIVAMLVAAGIVTADMIQTGVLQSQDGSSWFNLDNGTFNLKDMFKWVNNLLTLNQPDDEARLLVGPNVFAMQAYDETEEDWVNKIYFDPVRGKYVFDGLLSADAIQAVAAVIDYVVSDITFTQILYAEKGNISELTVDQLDTSTMVAKYLNSDTSNVDYIKIWGQHIHWIEAVVKDGDPTPTVQLTDRKGNPLYWVDEESIGMYTTFEETDYPVVVYEYDLNPKLKIDFELDPVTGYNVPIMTWGMGSDPTGQTNKGKGYIYKDETGLIFRYINEYNKTFDLRIGEDGVQTTGIGDAPASKGLVRNTFVSTDEPGGSDGEDGDVWLRYQDTGGGEE